MSNHRSNLLFLLLIVTHSFQSCTDSSATIPAHDQKTFQTYWSQGKAEISSYKLSGAVPNPHTNGTATLIFITENYSKSKLQKLESAKFAKTDLMTVLRCNHHQDIITGIDQYNIMTSVITPLEHADNPHCLHVSTGIQDWSGQTYIDLSWKGHRYEVMQHNYLDIQPLQDKSMANTWLEDEILAKIRISPEALPVGKIRMVPGTAYARLLNKKLDVLEADAKIEEAPSSYKYTVAYPALKRNVEFTFEKNFPYKITAWKEWQDGKEIRSGVLLKTIMSDYWNHTSDGHSMVRDSLYTSE